ncbi:MAG: efflux RND transporter periplasmic adaptor subunit [Polyangiales bacterium]
MSEQIHDLAPGPRSDAPVSHATGTDANSGRSRSIWIWIAVIAAAALAFFLWQRSRHQPEEAAAAGGDKPARDVPYLDGAYIRYSQGFAERNKLEFAPVESGTLSPVVHVTGTVDFDPDQVSAIGARIAGRVRNVFKLEGDQVKVGDVLAEIESAELGEAQAALISARAHADAALANERREKELAQAKISSNRDAELAAASAASARADLLATEGRVRAMGGKTNGEPGILTLQSPIAGKVVARNLWRGQFVEPTLTAFKVANLSRVFVELAVFERDVATIRVGDAVEFFAPGSAKTQVSGRVAYVGDEIDLQTKTAAVRVIVEQPATPLRPGQSISAKIHTSAKAEPSVVLPRDAVTSVDGKSTVFIAHDELSVEPRAIELGRQDGHQVEIVNGLKIGERVIVNGVFALKSEIFR